MKVKGKRNPRRIGVNFSERYATADGISHTDYLKLVKALGQVIVNVTLTGSKNANLIGNAYDNLLTANRGDNILEGGPGNDHLDGGEGKDTAVFSGAHSEYEITNKNGKIMTSDNQSSRDGIDTLINIEFLKFSDRIVKN